MPRKSMIVPRDDNGAHYPAVKLGAARAVAIGGTSAQSAAIESEVVRVVATCDCHIVQGADPTATTDDTLLPAGTVEYLRHVPDEKFAVIQAAGESGGTLHITEGR